MTKKEEILLETITAIDDRGVEYSIQHIQEYLVSDGERIKGYSRYQLANGGAVNFIDENTFGIVTRGTTAKRK
ncbi:hypothetical protein [Pseudomonas sp. S9]|uniref:hypothetical protein n=1 Tax=Pseudomonas sp. S9 TaxID=686578 RepID=UPI0002556DF1|nr:hypothetical protein [Pseudomonas sp. S9]